MNEKMSPDDTSQFGLSELRFDLGKKEDTPSASQTMLLDGKGTVLEGNMSMSDDSKLLVHEKTYNDAFMAGPSVPSGGGTTAGKQEKPSTHINPSP